MLHSIITAVANRMVYDKMCSISTFFFFFFAICYTITYYVTGTVLGLEENIDIAFVPEDPNLWVERVC